MEDEYTRHARAFASMVHNKGYLGDFHLFTHDGAHKLREGLLQKCLHEYLNLLAAGKSPEKRFMLQTYAEYLSANDYKQCCFHAKFDPKTGFNVDHLEIISKHPDQRQRIAVKRLQDIPGKNAVLGRFRKPRPWDRATRREFGNKKRR